MSPATSAPHRFLVAPEAFESVASVHEAVERLGEGTDDIAILAGGTDLMLQGQRGEVAPRMLLHLGAIDELRHIDRADGALRIGSLVTHRQLQDDPLLASFPALREAAATVGGWQTQAIGPLVGNVCNASPAADTLPPLLVSDARVELASARGTRAVAMEDFILGRRSTDRRPDELVTAIELPWPADGSGEVYLKVAPRSAMEVALVGLAIRLAPTPSGSMGDVRIALCAVGPRPFRARAAERILAAGGLEPDTVAAAGAALAAEAAPIDDARASARYRRRILPALLDRAVGIARIRSGR